VAIWIRSKIQWENTKRKGRCQCYAGSDGNGQGQNYRYLFHGNLPFFIGVEIASSAQALP
jgi:hypothetical protein